MIRDILAPFLEKGGLGGEGGHSPHSKEGGGGGASRRRSSIGLPKPKGRPITLSGGVFKKGAKALGTTSKQERMANLKIRESSAKGVYVEGLSSCGVTTTVEMSAVINGATENRQVRATKMNAESSRSHLIFTVELEIYDGKSKKNSKLNMIDLAGSERSKATGATGDSLKEGANINKSLSTLGRVIAALSDTKSKAKAPFRDSKLTHLLKDSLCGNCSTSMCAAVHGAALYVSLIQKNSLSVGQIHHRLSRLFTFRRDTILYYTSNTSVGFDELLATIFSTSQVRRDTLDTSICRFRQED
jgi:hypothetical protein